VMVELNECDAPRLSTETVDSTPVPEHGDKLQRFARREVLGARNDLLRTNPYWRTFEACRWVVEYFRGRALEAKRVRPDPGAAPATLLAQHSRTDPALP